MRKLAILASPLFAAIAMAAPVTPEQALQTASQFMQQHRAGVMLQSTPANKAPRIKAGGKPSTTQLNYYVFNTTGNKGYVIVSGDDRAQDILASGDRPLDMARMPENMRFWLSTYQRQIEFLQAHPYHPLVISKQEMTIAIKRMTIVGFYG